MAVSIDSFRAVSSAGINLDLLGGSQRGLDDEAPVYRYGTSLELTGLCTYPEERAGGRYDMTLYTVESDSPHGAMRIKHLHARDGHGMPRYKKLKSGSFPIYRDPPGLGYIEKIRGQPRYSIVIWVGPQVITDALVLLSLGEPIFASIHERAFERKREVREFTIQATDPAEE